MTLTNSQKRTINAYIDALVWSAGEEFDNCVASDQLKAAAEGACVAFLNSCDDLYETLSDAEQDAWNSLTSEDIGHNFALSRNRHGAGFFDRGLGSLGDKLQKLADSFGTCELFLQDDEIFC